MISAALRESGLSRFLVSGRAEDISSLIKNIASEFPHRLESNRFGYQLEIDCEYCTMIFRYQRKHPSRISVIACCDCLGTKMTNNQSMSNLLLNDWAATMQQMIAEHGYQLAIAV